MLDGNPYHFIIKKKKIELLRQPVCIVSGNNSIITRKSILHNLTKGLPIQPNVNNE